MFFEFERRRQQVSALVVRSILAIVRLQFWLVVERVDMRRTATHAGINDPLGLRRKMRLLGSQRVFICSRSSIRTQSRKRHHPESTGNPLQHLASCPHRFGSLG